MLEGKTAIVTGATSGIGRATALLFAQEGANVVVSGRRGHELQELVRQVITKGGRGVGVQGDVAHEDHALALVDAARRNFERVDIAVNNAGMLGALGPACEMEAENWQRTLDVNLTGAFFGAKHQIKAMIEHGGGSLIFVSTFVGHTAAFPGTAAYAASKAGLIGLTQALAVEYGSRNIRVNAILPGGTDTPMGATMTSTPEARKAIEGLHALKRLARPEEIARSLLYLASDSSSFMTGAALLVDGGASINRT